MTSGTTFSGITVERSHEYASLLSESLSENFCLVDRDDVPTCLLVGLLLGVFSFLSFRFPTFSNDSVSIDSAITASSGLSATGRHLLFAGNIDITVGTVVFNERVSELYRSHGCLSCHTTHACQLTRSVPSSGRVAAAAAAAGSGSGSGSGSSRLQLAAPAGRLPPPAARAGCQRSFSSRLRQGHRKPATQMTDMAECKANFPAAQGLPRARRC